MSHRDLQTRKAESLASIWSLASDDELWRHDELAAIWRHQLAAPVALDLSLLGTVPGRHYEVLCRNSDPPITSFGGLFHHRRPPFELLQGTKDFSKACRNRDEAPIPEAIATILYLLSIVTARMKLDRRISKLDDRALQNRVQWALEQPWLDDQTRAIFREEDRALSTKECESHG